MNNHTEILNYLIKKFDLKSYCEIGTFNKDHNFNLIECKKKLCIDPDPNAAADWLGTSDSFFRFVKHFYPETKIDIFWIDGLHEEAQVRKDFDNCLRYLNWDGFICLHDVNPHSESITHYPRDSREWCGTTFKFAMTLHNYPDIEFITLNTDYGVCIVRKRDFSTGGFINKTIETTWDYFDKHRKELLNLVSVEEGLKIINSWVKEPVC